MSKYTPAEIEPKWQAFWAAQKTFKTPADTSKPKFYCLDMFPYPSGAGLHVGHPEGYTATDILCRYKRSRGFNVLHPMGWDAFGLPAEQYAIKTGTHPAVTTQKNCDNFRDQIQRLGLSYDWDREISTTDPQYYKWTQWIFTRLYATWFDADQQKGRPIAELPIPAEIRAAGTQAVRDYQAQHRLAYFAEAKVWFCNTCKTVCANEEVLGDGSHEKCGTKDVRKTGLKQWQLRIPHYAERLLSGLDDVDWPEGIKEMQRNWIGRSTGAEVDFAVETPAGSSATSTPRKLRVYTTRPDTLFGATYMVVSPEHELLAEIVSPEQRDAVTAYQKQASLKSDLERTELAKEKSGVFTGAYGINPVNGERIPIWMADYVLTGYGTGAIMAVPAHDTRDFEFAVKFGLPIRCIMAPDTDHGSADDTACHAWPRTEMVKLLQSPEGRAQIREAVLEGRECWTADGAYIRSSSTASGLGIDGLAKEQGVATVTAWLVDRNLGVAKVNYKLRDWLFSRQRYWGEPFPIIHWEDGEIGLVPDDQLPLTLPDLAEFHPSDSGESPLARAGAWLEVTDPATGRKGRRETNTMPQWAGSCWYYLRFIDPRNDLASWDRVLENYWMPVDLYVGGAEHAVLHLLYSRFWHKVLFDLGLVSTGEPFQRLFNQGLILAFAYEDSVGSKVPSDEVEERDGKFFHKTDGRELKQIVAKMSKSLKNVVNPDEVVNEFGADTLRLYEMFMGPLDMSKPWQPSGLEGIYRFLQKAWRHLVPAADAAEAADDGSRVGPRVSDEPMSRELQRLVHQSILKVGGDIEGMRFNTAISQLMIFNNELGRLPTIPRPAAETFVQLLAPFAPHLAEELWSSLGKRDLSYTPWPVGDTALAADDEVEVVLQVNGKVRAKVQLAKGMTREALEQLARTDERILKWTEGKEIVKLIAVPDKLVNLVVK